MKLNEIELDAFAEIINIGAGRAASALSEMTDSRIELSVPSIHVCSIQKSQETVDKFKLEFGTTVQQGFEGNVSGRALLAFPNKNAFELARIVGGIDATGSEMDEELFGILEEIGNIVLNAVLGSISNLLDCDLAYTLPELCTNKTATEIIRDFAEGSERLDSVVLFAKTSLTVASHRISGTLLLLFETGEIESLLSRLIADPTT